MKRGKWARKTEFFPQPDGSIRRVITRRDGTVEKDHIIPASLNKTNYERYQAGRLITDFKVFPGRDHFVIGERGWQEVADYALAWLEEKAV